MRKVFFLNFCYLLFAISGFAQGIERESLSTVHGIDMSSQTFFRSIPVQPGRLVGDTYVDPKWRMSAIHLYENDIVLEGYPLRFDILANELEVHTVEGIKVLHGEAVSSFMWIDEETNVKDYYINAKEFEVKDNKSHTGFYHILSDGAMPLLKRTKILVKKPDYNPNLNMGSPDTKIIKTYEYYYVKDKQVFRLSSLSKKVIPVFEERSGEMKAFIADNSLSAANEKDLVKMFEHYNSQKN
jgi:hypothetical protein